MWVLCGRGKDVAGSSGSICSEYLQHTDTDRLHLVETGRPAQTLELTLAIGTTEPREETREENDGGEGGRDNSLSPSVFSVPFPQQSYVLYAPIPTMR